MEENKMEKLRKYNESSYYGSEDITEKLLNNVLLKITEVD